MIDTAYTSVFVQQDEPFTQNHVFKKNVLVSSFTDSLNKGASSFQLQGLLGDFSMENKRSGGATDT